MSDSIETDIMRILNSLYEHGFTPKQAMKKIQERFGREISILSKPDEEDDEQITVKLDPLKSHKIPLKLNKNKENFTICLQKDGIIKEEDK